MQYFYLLNNKDIYGINGRFFGPSLNVCDCVDYFQQIGVPEGTSMDLTFGGFNGCYVYANNRLIKTLPSCGYAPLTCEGIADIEWALKVCSCKINKNTPYESISNNIYFQFSNNLVNSTDTIVFQMSYEPTWVQNSTQKTINLYPGQYHYFSSAGTLYNIGLQTKLTYYARIKKLCSNGLWSPWSNLQKNVPDPVMSNQLYTSCSMVSPYFMCDN